MTYDDAYKEWGDIKTVSFLIKVKGKTVSVSSINCSGGVCSCCEEFDDSDKGIELLKVINISNMKILFDAAT